MVLKWQHNREAGKTNTSIDLLVNNNAREAKPLVHKWSALLLQ